MCITAKLLSTSPGLNPLGRRRGIESVGKSKQISTCAQRGELFSTPPGGASEGRMALGFC